MLGAPLLRGWAELWLEAQPQTMGGIRIDPLKLLHIGVVVKEDMLIKVLSQQSAPAPRRWLVKGLRARIPCQSRWPPLNQNFCAGRSG